MVYCMRVSRLVEIRSSHKPLQLFAEWGFFHCRQHLPLMSNGRRDALSICQALYSIVILASPKSIQLNRLPKCFARFCAATRSTKESRSCNTSIGLFGSSYGGTISPRRSSSALQAGGASSRRIPRKSGTLGCVENHVVHPGCSCAVVAASAHRLKNLEQRAHRPIERSKSL